MIWSRADDVAPQNARTPRLQQLAKDALERACVEPWCEPYEIIRGLGRPVRAMTRSEHRAVLVRGCVDYLWQPGEPLETNLNLFTGAALAVLEDAGITRPNPADVARVAGHLALPDIGVSPETELFLQVHAPPWFLREHQKRRRWDRWSASGVFAAISR